MGELVTFNFHFIKIPSVFILMIFGLSGHVHDPNTNYVHFGPIKLIIEKYKKIPNDFRGLFFLEIAESTNRKIGKGAYGKVLEICLIIS